MTARSRDDLIASISERLTSPELSFISHWKKTSQPLLEMLPYLDIARLEALENVTHLYFSTTKSRMLSLSFLSDPTHAETTWEVVSTISDHSEWLLANADRYDKVVHTLMQLRDHYGIAAGESGRVDSLMAHIKVQGDYSIRSESLHLYLRNEEVVRLVERHYGHVDAFISYGGARGYVGLNDEDFLEYLTQHDALQEGWL